jgi:hypothetical protein
MKRAVFSLSSDRVPCLSFHFQRSEPMPFVTGFLRVRRRGGHPDQGLPGEGEGSTDPDDGIEGEGPDQGLPALPPVRPDAPNQGLPRPPPGVFPPLTPSHPIQPARPGVPPGTIWPPVGGPDQGLPDEPGAPGQGLPPGAPGAPGQGLPGRPVGPDQGLPSKTFWVVAGIPGVGWRYICVDPSLKPTPHR